MLLFEDEAHASMLLPGSGLLYRVSLEGPDWMQLVHSAPDVRSFAAFHISMTDKEKLELLEAEEAVLDAIRVDEGDEGVILEALRTLTGTLHRLMAAR